jgi:hypothetical protein
VRKFVKFPQLWRVTMTKYGARAADYVVALELLDRAQWEPTCEVREALTN